MYVHHHAIDRYRDHHPKAEVQDLLDALQRGDPLHKRTALAIVGRGCRKDTTSDYVLTPDRKGMFVLEGPQVVTYLMFQRSQTVFCVDHYGVGEADLDEIHPPEPPEPLALEPPAPEPPDSPDPNVDIDQMGEEEARNLHRTLSGELIDLKRRRKAEAARAISEQGSHRWTELRQDWDKRKTILVKRVRRSERRLKVFQARNKEIDRLHHIEVEGLGVAPADVDASQDVHAAFGREGVLAEILHRAEKVSSDFDTATWEQVTRLRDPETGLEMILRTRWSDNKAELSLE